MAQFCFNGTVGKPEIAKKPGWYTVPAWFTGEGILRNSSTFGNDVVLLSRYTPDIVVEPKDTLPRHPLGILAALFSQKYRPVVEFRFGGTNFRGAGSLRYMSFVTEDVLAFYAKRAGTVSLLYRGNSIVTFYSCFLKDTPNTPNRALGSLSEVLDSGLFKGEPPGLW